MSSSGVFVTVTNVDARRNMEKSAWQRKRWEKLLFFDLLANCRLALLGLKISIQCRTEHNASVGVNPESSLPDLPDGADKVLFFRRLNNSRPLHKNSRFIPCDVSRDGMEVLLRGKPSGQLSIRARDHRA